MRSIRNIKNSIGNTIILSFFVVFLFSVVSMFFVHVETINQTKIFNQKQIQNIIKIYQINLSEKIAILASSDEFIDYIRSGSISRKHLLSSLSEKIFLLKPLAISGINVKQKKSKKTLLNIGRQTRHKVILKLCYFNDNLNDVLGNYNFDMVLFLDKKVVKQGLKNLDKNIVITNNNSAIVNFFLNRQFGNFDVTSHTPFCLNIEYSNKQRPLFLYYIIIIFITLTAFVLWNHFRLKIIFNKYIAAPIRNITERIKASEEPMHTKDEVQEFSYLINQIKNWQMELNRVKQNEQLATIGRATSFLAHDVRKPFTMLKMMLQMLPKLTPAQIKNYSENLDISIRKVEAMLADIMEASREMKYELIPRNILSVLDLAIKDVSRYYPGKYIDFYYSFDAINLIELDEQRMCRAFENIVDNAFDCLPNEKGFMWFSIQEKENKAEIVIGNSHSHISEDQINKIFQDKFTFGKKEGTGLGLSIVTKIINGHEGSVFAKNVQLAPSFVPEEIRNIQGVEFEIILPLTKKPGYSLKDTLLKNSEEAKAKLGMVEKKSQLAGSSEIGVLVEKLELLKQKPNLLILDDESIYRMKIRDVLENLGELNKLIHVYDASSYKEAIDILNHTKIDYLICDIDLSDKEYNGFSVLSKVLEKHPDSMVLVHTNQKGSVDIIKAKTLGACGFCPKPITEAILVDLLLDKKLWPSGFKKAHPQKTGKRIAEYVKTIPSSNILIVNDDLIALKFMQTMMGSCIDPKDNISIFTASNYMEAKSIVDSETVDLLISDFNLDSVETGVDVCSYMKGKKPESVCVIYSGIIGGKIEELKETNKDCVDGVFSNSYEAKDILRKAFRILRKKK